MSMSQQSDLSTELKKLIVENLNLTGVEPDSIGDHDPLFGEGLGLDSVDALELVVALERQYGIRIQSDEADREVFSNVASLSRYIEQRRAESEGTAG
jgi:acyl carrier protein